MKSSTRDRHGPDGPGSRTGGYSEELVWFPEDVMWPCIFTSYFCITSNPGAKKCLIRKVFVILDFIAFSVDDHMKIAVAYFLFELIVLTAEFVLLVIFTAVCCWAILGIYCQKRREIREEIARMKKTSSGSVSQAGVVFRRHHHNMAHSMPTVIMGTSTCNSENLSSPNESRGTQSNVCFGTYSYIWKLIWPRSKARSHTEFRPGTQPGIKTCIGGKG